jgi:hypothetical protein
MDFNVWRRHYLENKRNRPDRPEPRWDAPQTLDGPTRWELARSLAHFQLGESGDGATFLRWARERAPGPGFGEAAALFIAEETEHARLLKHLVLRFGGELITSHWTHSVFKRLRNLAGLGFEMQVLLVAETLGTAYYRLLAKRCNDPAIQDACALILRDEEAHLRFHADHERALTRGVLGSLLAKARLALILNAATIAAWADHGPALRFFGVGFADFRRQVVTEIEIFRTRVRGVENDLAISLTHWTERSGVERKGS